MLSPRAVFDETHHQAVALVDIDDNCRDCWLLQLDECFEPPLTADEVVLSGLGVRALAHGNRPLQADAGDVFDDLLEVAPVSNTRVQDPDAVRRDQRHVLTGCAYAVFRH